MALRVFLTCWAVYTFFWTPFIVREHFPAITLAESGTLNVQRYDGWIEDIFTGPRGGAYINNNPGASLTGSIPLILLRPVLERLDNWNQRRPRPDDREADSQVFRRTLQEGRALYFLLVAFLTVALAMAPATAATAAYLCRRIQQRGVPAATAASAALLYGIGTPVLFRIGHLNHNLLAGDAGFAALLLLWDPEGTPPGGWRALLAGLLAGYSVLCDYSGAVIVFGTALYLIFRLRGIRVREAWPKITAFAVGVLPGLATLVLYQFWAFGSLYPAQQFMPPTAPTLHGYRGFDWPSPALIWANFIDPRFGLFAYCPALLLSLAAPFVGRVRYRIPRLEKSVLFTWFALFVLFCGANRYSWLQPLTGFRYLVPVVPALALLALEAGQALPRIWRRIVAAAACGQSLLLAAAHENDIRLAASTLWRRGFRAALDDPASNCRRSRQSPLGAGPVSSAGGGNRNHLAMAGETWRASPSAARKADSC